MRRQHRAGEALKVDYAGMTLSVIDKGVVRQAQVFVACLPCSDLTYAEASWTQGHEDWLGAHVRAFAYIDRALARHDRRSDLCRCHPRPACPQCLPHRAAGRLDADLMEVIDDRHQRASTILATQIPIRT